MEKERLWLTIKKVDHATVSKIWIECCDLKCRNKKSSVYKTSMMNFHLVFESDCSMSLSLLLLSWNNIFSFPFPYFVHILIVHTYYNNDEMRSPRCAVVVLDEQDILLSAVINVW